MEDKFDKELEERYLSEFNIDIGSLKGDELRAKGKDKSIENRVLYIRAALEKTKQTFEDNSYNPRYLRRVEMEHLLKYYLNDGTKNDKVVWRGYLLHVEKGVELPLAFEERIQEELLKIAKKKLGPDKESYFAFQAKKNDIYQEDILRVDLLIEVIDTLREEDLSLDVAYATVSAKYQKKGYPWVNSERLKGLYNTFVRHGTIASKN